MQEKNYSYKVGRALITKRANETNKRHWLVPSPTTPKRYIITTVDPRPVAAVTGSFVYADPNSIGGVAFSISPGLTSTKPKLRQPDAPGTSHARKAKPKPSAAHNPAKVLDTILADS